MAENTKRQNTAKEDTEGKGMAALSTNEIQERLEALADPKYRDFHSKLLPGTENVMGVRTPDLRKLAKEIIKGD